MRSLDKTNLQKLGRCLIMPTMPKEKRLIIPGEKIGILEVGDLVRNVKDHPLYPDTPLSYISHWRLFECYCECGVVKLYSENVLVNGHVKSCGCLRAKKKQEAWQRKQGAADKKAKKKEIRFRLSMARDKLALLRMAPLGQRNEERIEETAAEIRKLHAMQAFANRV